MHQLKKKTVFLIAIIALSTGAEAQKIFKCGTTYSQLACPEGVIIKAASTPDAAEKGAADQATRRDALTADQMEKSRLAQEKKDLAANMPAMSQQHATPTTSIEDSPSRKKRSTQGKQQEFRALIPATVSVKKRSRK